MITWLWLLALAVLVAAVAGSEKWQETVVALLVVSAFIQALFSHYVWWGGGGKILESGTFYAPNQYAGFLLLLAPICLSLLFSSRDFLRTVLMIVVSTFVYGGIVLSGSRWGLVSAAIGGVVTLIAGRFRPRALLIRGAILAAVLVGFLFLMTSRTVAPLYFEASGGSLLGPADAKGEGWLDGLELRLRWARVAFDLGIERPLTGGGLGTFGDRHLELISPDDPWSKFAHNDYLEVFADLGILGALAFFGFSGYVLRQGWRAARSRWANAWTAGLLGGLFGAALHVLLDHDWTYPAFGGAFVIASLMLLSGKNVSDSLSDATRDGPKPVSRLR